MITSDSDTVKTDIQTPRFEFCVAVQNKGTQVNIFSLVIICILIKAENNKLISSYQSH
jgi:hypothetical protein